MRIVLLVMMIMALSSCKSTAYKPYQPKPSNGESETEKFIVLGGSYMYIGLFKPKMYVLKNQRSLTFTTNDVFQILHYSDDSGYGHKSEKQYFNIGGNAEKLELNSNAKLDYWSKFEYWYATHKGSDDVELEFSVAGKSKKVTIDVIELPLSQGATAQDVIEVLGFPSRKMKRYASWPCTEYVNGIGYDPVAGSGGISIEQWFYDKYPNLIIDVTYRDVSVYTYGSRDRTFDTC
ncbi:hypothetical protein [Thalassotalea profundi]|uniref:Lipoprotein n=1 Tax=Thalassotalea profundi TaxID=2036687 RepID=A0ABQ3IJC3_9GAMM|nr:hypothetical protein [Thalassotalea profundi]GHE86277.1 hypothetical protein GCM10011501_14240 [Thalassotalea profundi]